MSRQVNLAIVVIATIVLLGTVGLVALIAPGRSAPAGDAGAMLAFIAAVAIGIERFLELLWTMVGGFLGSYWPLNTVHRQVNGMVAALDKALKPFHEDLATKLAQIPPTPATGGVEAMQQEVAQLRARFDELKALAPDNQRIQLLTAAASQNVSYLLQKYNQKVPELQASARLADEAINSLQNFVASFKDNPGRRLISLYAGIVLGLIIAGALGLDLFQAALQVPPDQIANPRLNIILTGLVIGLGSSPTHEVVRAIQEYKKNVKGSNIQQPDQPDRLGDAARV